MFHIIDLYYTVLPGDRVYPPVRDYPQDGIPRSQPDLINCTVTILSGSRDREIGFLTEWMRAVAFIKSKWSKFQWSVLSRTMRTIFEGSIFYLCRFLQCSCHTGLWLYTLINTSINSHKLR